MKSFVKNIALTALLLCFCGLSICLAQDDDPNKLMLKKGKLLSKESVATAAGGIQIAQYRLEQVELTKPYDKRDDKPPLENVFRIVIVTEQSLPFNDYSIWIDHYQRDAYTIKSNALAILIYERTLPDGTIKLAISKRSERNSESRSVLTGTLSVPSEYATPLAEVEANRPVIKLRRLVTGIRRIELRIEFRGGRCGAVAAASNPLTLKIDGQSFNMGCDGDEVIIARFSNDEFAQLRDGAEIALKFASDTDITGRGVVGRLDKSSLR